MAPSNKPIILLLGAHRWRRQPVVQIAKSAGFTPMLFLYDQEELPTELARNIHPSYVIRQSLQSPYSASQIAEMMTNIGQPWYVLGLDDYVCEFAAEISAYSAKRTMPLYAARETLQKHLLRRRWNRLCTENPRLFPVPFRLFRFSDSTFERKVDEEEDLVFDKDAHLILKPDALDASIGIHKPDSWDQVESALAAIRSELATLAKDVVPIGIDITPAIIIEQRIPRSTHLHAGAEFSAEFLSIRLDKTSEARHCLLGITQKYIHPETFVEVAHCFPSETFPDTLVAEVQAATASLLEELRVEFGISHWEYIVCEDGRLALVEAQLRPAGDRIMDLVLRSTDSSPYVALFSAFLKEGTEIPPFFPKRKAAVFFPQPEHEVAGRLSILHDDKSTASPSGQSYFIESDIQNNHLRWGGKVFWHSRLVSIITSGDTFEEAKQNCEAMLPLIQVRCVPEQGREETVPLILPI